MSSTPDEVKTCCAAAYSSDAVRLLLGDAYHPGGLKLTRRLASLLGLPGGAGVLDVAAGRGTTALLLAREHQATVTGVDLSATNMDRARNAATTAGLADRVSFTVADAEHLPYADTTFHAVVCECAFCTFPAKPAAAAELARVLRPGGRLGLTDVTADPDRLPPELTSVHAWVACIADARPLPEYVGILTAAGLHVVHTERQDQAILHMIDQIQARLSVAAMTARTQLDALGIDLDQAETMLGAARAAVADGVLGYSLLIAEKP